MTFNTFTRMEVEDVLSETLSSIPTSKEFRQITSCLQLEHHTAYEELGNLQQIVNQIKQSDQEHQLAISHMLDRKTCLQNEAKILKKDIFVIQNSFPSAIKENNTVAHELR